MDVNDVLLSIQQELKRGTLVLAVLTQMDQPQYGYSLIQALTDQGMEVEQNTLYPLLRRLEKQGLLESDWDVEGSRPRRYYKISNDGIKVRSLLLEDWKKLNEMMFKMMEGLK